jgi:hypothetical protein
LRNGRRALERSDARLQSCDLSFLLFELAPLFLDLLMRDGLSEEFGSIQESVASKTGRYEV